MSELLQRIKARIKLEGPLLVSDYMGEALFNPEFGYYMTRDPIGKRGDFITAPEISQMFGELIGLWSASVWEKMGSPRRINLIEIGPGRGTLMADALRAISAIPSFLDAINIHLVENSPSLQKRQKRNLETLSCHIEWHESFLDVSEGPFILIANELFDVLPIRQFVKLPNSWVERKVGCNDQGQLTWLLDNDCLISENLIPARLTRSAAGSVFELGQIGEDLIKNITKAIIKFGGAALVIDYGHLASGVGDTLQGVKDHNYFDVLKEPGEVDLTAHVDFECLAKTANSIGRLVCGPVTQREFLRRLGIETRASQLKEVASTRQKSEVLTSLNRLIGVDEMGDLFKVMAITHLDPLSIEGF